MRALGDPNSEATQTSSYNTTTRSKQKWVSECERKETIFREFQLKKKPGNLKGQ